MAWVPDLTGVQDFRELSAATGTRGSSSWIFPALAIVRCLSSPLSWEHAQNPPVKTKEVVVLKVLFRPAFPSLFGTRDQFWRRACFHVLNIHWKDWCRSWSSSTLATCEEPTHWKRPWCWDRLKAEKEGDDRGWDGWMASPTRWTWVWASSRSWWWTGKSGVLPSMGSQGVDMTEWLNRTELMFPWTGQRRRFGGDSSTLHPLCILFLLLSHHLLLRSSAIRSQRPGTHEFSDHFPHKISPFTFLRWNFHSQLKRTQVFTWETKPWSCCHSEHHNGSLRGKKKQKHGSQNCFLMKWDCDVHLWS